MCYPFFLQFSKILNHLIRLATSCCSQLLYALYKQLTKSASTSTHHIKNQKGPTKFSVGPHNFENYSIKLLTRHHLHDTFHLLHSNRLSYKYYARLLNTRSLSKTASFSFDCVVCFVLKRA